MRIKSILKLLSILLLFTTLGCTNNNSNNNSNDNHAFFKSRLIISGTDSSSIVKVGGSTFLKLSVDNPTDIVGYVVPSIVSSDPKILTVDNNLICKLTREAQSCMITVKALNNVGNAHIIVSAPKFQDAVSPEIYVEDIPYLKFDAPENSNITFNHETTIKLSVNQDNISSKVQPVITSSDPTVLDIVDMSSCANITSELHCNIKLKAFNKVGNAHLIAELGGYHGDTSQNITVHDKPFLAFGKWDNEILKIGAPGSITLSANKDDIEGDLVPEITVANGKILAVDGSADCHLTKQSPSCIIKVKALNQTGKTYIIAKLPEFYEATSSELSITDIPYIKFGPFASNYRTFGQYDMITLSANPDDLTDAITPIISSSDDTLLKVYDAPSSCILRKSKPFCTITVQAQNKPGVAHLVANVSGFHEDISQILEIKDKPSFTFGRFDNKTLKPGQSAIITLSINKDDFPKYVTDIIPTITSSDSNILSIDSTSKCTLTAVSPSCTIKVTSLNKVGTAFLQAKTPNFYDGFSESISVVSIPTIQFGEFSVSKLIFGGSATIKLSADSTDVLKDTSVTISTDATVLNISDNYCKLTHEAPFCEITVHALNKAGSARLSAYSPGFLGAVSNVINVTDKTHLQFDTFADKSLKFQQTTTINLSANKDEITQTIAPEIISSDPTVLVVKSSCNMTQISPNCIINVQATNKAGKAHLIINDDKFYGDNSADIEITGENPSVLSTHIIAGNNGTIYFNRYDSNFWQPRMNQFSSNFNAGVYGNNQYVVVGENGIIVTSSNGSIWNLSPDSGKTTLEGLNAVLYVNNRYIAVGNHGVVISSFDGKTWKLSSSSGINQYNLKSIAYGNGKYLALGGNNVVITSNDGNNWQLSPTPKFDNPKCTIPQSAASVIYANNSFYITTGENCMLQSSDGNTWKTLLTLQNKDYTNLYARALGITYANNQFVTVGSGGDIMLSSDGDNWKYATSSGIVSTVHFGSVSYCLGKYVATGFFGDIIYSIDGNNWNLINMIPATDMHSVPSVISGKNECILVGDNSSIIKSIDGYKWAVITTTSPDYTSNVLSITNDSNQYVAVGRKGIILRSQNGEVWVPAQSSSKASKKDLYSIIYNDHKYIAVGDNGIIVSRDGDTWDKIESPTVGSTLNSIAFGENGYIAIANNGTIMKSLDGEKWDIVSPAKKDWYYLRSVIYNNHQYIAVGSNLILQSSNGTDWVVVANNFVAATNLVSVAHGNNKYVAVGTSGYNGVMFNSDDGKKWDIIKSTEINKLLANNFLNSITYSNSQFIAVGNNGTVIRSQDGTNWFKDEGFNEKVNLLNVI